MPTNKQIEAVRAVLRKYLNDSPLRPQYDGMNTHELATIILKEADKALYEEKAAEMKQHEAR